MLDRIALNPGRVQAMAQGLREVAALADPVREVVKMWRRPNGLQVGRMRIPLGVIGDDLRSAPQRHRGRGGAVPQIRQRGDSARRQRSASLQSSDRRGVARSLRRDPACRRMPYRSSQFKEHALVNELLQLEEYIDLIIPRGGEDLIRAVVANSKIPVIKHYKGVCHIYVDAEASIGRWPSASASTPKCSGRRCATPWKRCSFMKPIAAKFLPAMIAKYQAAGVEIRGCERT